MFCHNGYPTIPAANQAPGSDPVFLGELPEGIDCQRCHGPGGEHVRTRRPGEHRKSGEAESRAAHGGVHAVPPRNHQRPDSGGASAIRPRHVLLYSWTALGGFRDFLRPRARHRARRQIRGGELGLPAAAIALFPGERRETGMRHLSRSASDSARRGGGRGIIPAFACNAIRRCASRRRNGHRGGLHYVSYAEAPRG